MVFCLYNRLNAIILFRNYGGGHKVLNETHLMIIMLIFCAFIMFLAQINRLPSKKTKGYIEGLV